MYTKYYTVLSDIYFLSIGEVFGHEFEALCNNGLGGRRLVAVYQVPFQ